MRISAAASALEVILIDPLRDLETLLDNRKSLGMVKKRKIERFKWIGQNLATIRTTLINKATYLSIYHDMTR